MNPFLVRVNFTESPVANDDFNRRSDSIEKISPRFFKTGINVPFPSFSIKEFTYSRGFSLYYEYISSNGITIYKLFSLETAFIHEIFPKYESGKGYF